MVAIPVGRVGFALGSPLPFAKPPAGFAPPLRATDSLDGVEQGNWPPEVRGFGGEEGEGGRGRR
jgi:hypothetical protein